MILELLILLKKTGDQVKPQISGYTIPTHSEQELSSNWQNVSFSRLEQLDPENLEIKIKLATFYLFGKKNQEAESKVNHVLSKEPENIEALYLQAAILNANKDKLDTIKQVYDKILQIDPGQTKAHIALSQIFVSQKDFLRAEESLNSALKLNPDDINIHKILADFYLFQKDADAARKVLENLVKIKPDDAKALIMLGDFYLSQKNNKLAEKIFLTAIEKQPDNIAAYMTIATYYNSIKETIKAEQYILKALKIDSEHMVLKNAYADFQYTHKNYEKAETLVDEVLGKRPGYIPSKTLKGKILIQKKEYDGAIKIFQELVQEDPKSQIYNFLLGSAFYQKGDQTAALPFLSKTVDINPNNLSARLLMANIYYAKKDFLLAELEVKKILKTLPEDYNSNILLGNIYAAQKDYDSAENLFKNMILAAPEKPSAYFRLGILKHLQKDNKAAMANFEKALKLNPNLMDVFSSIISIYFSQKQFDKALERCDRQMTLVEDIPFIQSILFNLKGNALLGLNKIDQGKAPFEQSIKSNPKFVAPYLTLAKIYKTENLTDKEIEIYKALIENRSDLPAPHDILGTIYEKQGQYDLCESHYKKALEINPEYIPAMNNLAFFYAEQDKELNKALDLANSAKDKADNAPAVMDTLGWVYYKKELYESAVREFQGCVEKIPENPIFQYHMGLAYYKLGEYVKAETALKKALELNPDFKGADNAKKVLNQL